LSYYIMNRMNQTTIQGGIPSWRTMRRHTEEEREDPHPPRTCHLSCRRRLQVLVLPQQLGTAGLRTEHSMMLTDTKDVGSLKHLQQPGDEVRPCRALGVQKAGGQRQWQAGGRLNNGKPRIIKGQVPNSSHSSTRQCSRCDGYGAIP
jgi:hypothetical protein